jgi:hypothetical protein
MGQQLYGRLHPDRDSRVTDGRAEEARALATACGYVLGAASMCASISEGRIAVTAGRIAETLRLYGEETRENCAAAFEEAFADGKASIQSGEIDESATEQTLCSVERMLGK